MSKFVISAVMDEDKNLTVKSAAMQNQGENGSAQLTVSVPAEWAEKEFYAEFLCPHDRRFVSPQMQKASSENSFSCTLPACVLQEEGFVGFQLIVRNPADGTVFKSNYSKRSSFFVNASVNADKDVVAVRDFFSEAKQLVAQTEEKAQSAVERVQKAVLHTQQTLTEEQKRQARENIGAGTSSFGGSYDELTDKPVIPQVPQDIVKYSEQTLTEEQKRQARENIGAGTSSFGGSYDELTGKPVIPQVPQDIVKYSQQTLTEEQKQQARENIGAGTSSFNGSYDELTDKPVIPQVPQDIVKYSQQTLTEEQKRQARENIGAGTSSFSGSYDDLTDKPVIPQVPQDIVKYSEQTLTEEQKQQARENIGAGTSSFSGSYDELTDKPVIPQVPQDIVKYSEQTLTEEQKQQARENIGAGTSSFSGSYDELTDKPELPSTWVTSVGGLTGKVNIGKGITTSGTSLVTSQYADLTSYRLAANEFARIDDMCHGSLDLLTYGNALTDGKLTFRKRGANDYEDVYINIPQNAQYTVMKVLIFLRAFIIRGTFYTEGYEKIQDFDLMIDFGLKYFGIGVTTEESYDSVVYAIRQLSLS